MAGVRIRLRLAPQSGPLPRFPTPAFPDGGPNSVLDRPCPNLTEPALASRAEPHPRALAEQWLRKCAVRAGEAQRVLVVRAELDDFQASTAKVHKPVSPAFSQAVRQTGHHAATPRINIGDGKSDFQGIIVRYWRSFSGSQLAERRDKVGSHAVCSVDAGSKTTRSTIDLKAKHVSPAHAVLHHLVMVKSAGRKAVCLGEPREIACQTLHHRCAEPDRVEMESRLRGGTTGIVRSQLRRSQDRQCSFKPPWLFQRDPEPACVGQRVGRTCGTGGLTRAVAGAVPRWLPTAEAVSGDRRFSSFSETSLSPSTASRAILSDWSSDQAVFSSILRLTASAP